MNTYQRIKFPHSAIIKAAGLLPAQCRPYRYAGTRRGARRCARELFLFLPGAAGAQGA